MDALSDLLRVIRFSGGLYLEAKFRSPWCLISQVKPEDFGISLKKDSGLVAFHYLLDGQVEVRVGDEPPLTAGPGDMIVAPQNDPHVMGSSVSMLPFDAAPLIRQIGEHTLASIDYGSGDQTNQHFVCGFLSTTMRDHPLLVALPPLLVTSLRGTPSGDWAESSFRYAAREHAAQRPGSNDMLARLSELLFVEAVRAHIEQLSGKATGWLAALRDPALAPALSALHARPMHPWTAEGLAEVACLSRSAFAERFTSIVGQPPMSYLTRWRMVLAGQRLRESTETIAQIAEAVGYESESTFSRAFAREMGMAPGAWRKR